MDVAAKPISFPFVARCASRGKGERSGQRGRFLKTEPIANDHPAVVIFNRREPGLGRGAGFIEQQDIQWGVIGLPHGIGVGRFSPIKQVKLLAVSGGSLMGHRHQRRIEVLDNLADAMIAGRRPPLFFGNGTHLAMNGGHRTGRGL